MQWSNNIKQINKKPRKTCRKIRPRRRRCNHVKEKSFVPEKGVSKSMQRVWRILHSKNNPCNFFLWKILERWYENIITYYPLKETGISPVGRMNMAEGDDLELSGLYTFRWHFANVWFNFYWISFILSSSNSYQCSSCCCIVILVTLRQTTICISVTSGTPS